MLSGCDSVEVNHSAATATAHLRRGGAEQHHTLPLLHLRAASATDHTGAEELQARCERGGQSLRSQFFRVMGILYSEPICSAAYNDDFNQVYQLLTENALSLNVQDKVFGDTAIIAACRSGSIRVAKYLLSKKADVSIRNKKERTCLHYIAKKRFSFLDYLIIIVLMPILLIGYFVMMEKQKKHVSLTKLILNSGVEVDAVDNKGNTALHYACLSKSHKIIPLLLEKNADISIKNKAGETPLDIAERLDFSKVIVMLKKSK